MMYFTNFIVVEFNVCALQSFVIDEIASTILHQRLFVSSSEGEPTICHSQAEFGAIF